MTAVVNAVGWALLHFVWQGALGAAIFTVAVRLLRTPEARYALGVGAMFAMLALPVVTATRYGPSADRATQRSASPANTAGPSVASPSPTTQTETVESASAAAVRGSHAVSESDVVAGARTPWDRLTSAFAPLANSLPLLVACWLTGVFILSLRLFDAWLHARRLTREGTRPAPEAHRQMLQRLAERLRIWRPVTIVESTLLRVPAVVGWLRPIVLLPAVALTGLTAQQVEALIAHELAHVKRHDFLANIIQSAIETLLFYHPAVWYVSRRVREEREHCCDDIAMGICGNPDEYARALLRVAEGSVGAPALVTAATGGPLLVRVRRLLTRGSRPADTFPGWIVGSAVLLAAALLASAGRVLEANETRAATPLREQAEGLAAMTAFPADTDKVGADTVLHAPPGPLARRWQWARDEARRRGYRAFWIGYTIEPLASKENRSIYVGRMERHGLEGPGVSLRGRIISFGDFEGFRVPGVRLPPIVSSGMPDDVAILFLYAAGRDGRAMLARVHASSMVFPVDLEGRALMWLGEASDGESVPLVRGLYDEAPNADLREDVVAMVGVHSTSSLVVPVLMEWVEGRGPDGTRMQAVEWLAHHPTAAALNALARTARRDRVADVRREAAESVGQMDGPAAATDTLIALARTLEDTDARREAVEGLGERGDDRAVDALATIVREERNPDLQREGTESLGESHNPRSVPLLIEIAQTHPVSDVRREAIETVGENVPAEQAVPVLAAIARNDRNGDVQREAIESLGEMKDAGALAVVEELVTSHPNIDARREAIETLGETSPDGQTVEKLARMAREESNVDVVREAIETIAETHHADAPRIIAEIARTHRSPDVRREATETLAEVGDRGEAVKLLEEIAAQDADPNVRREAIETLGEAAPAERFVALARELLESNPPEEIWHEVLETLEELKGGEGIPLLVSTARSHGNPEIRQHAFRVLAESDDPRARKLFEDALSR